MARVTIIGPDGLERTLDLDPDQIMALHSLRKENSRITESARILKESLDKLDRANPDRAARAKRKLVGSY